MYLYLIRAIHGSSLGADESASKRSISVDSAVFAGLTVVTNRQTTYATNNIRIRKPDPHLPLLAALVMRAKSHASAVVYGM